MAMDGNATGGLPRFSVGTVIRASLAVLRANAWTFLGIILGVGLPAGVLLMVAVVGLAAGQSPSGASASPWRTRVPTRSWRWSSSGSSA
jgi:hypothetical protein